MDGLKNFGIDLLWLWVILGLVILGIPLVFLIRKLKEKKNDGNIRKDKIKLRTKANNYNNYAMLFFNQVWLFNIKLNKESKDIKNNNEIIRRCLSNLTSQNEFKVLIVEHKQSPQLLNIIVKCRGMSPNEWSENLNDDYNLIKAKINQLDSYMLLEENEEIQSIINEIYSNNTKKVI